MNGCGAGIIRGWKKRRTKIFMLFCSAGLGEDESNSK